MKPIEIIEKYEKALPVSSQQPSERFIDMFEHNKHRFRDIIMEIKQSDTNVANLGMRSGMVYPPHAVIDEKIKELCAIPFRRVDGRMAACEGVTENWKGCPPHSFPVTDTISVIKQATGFLIMQFDGIPSSTFQKYIHMFTLKVENALQEAGYTVMQGYSCGPCRICKQGCNSEGACRVPTHRRFALEACGFWVNQLCRKAAEFSVDGDNRWEIEWVIDWHLPTQSPLTFKSVTGILFA